MSSASDASTLSLAIALIVAALGGLIAWRDVNTSPAQPVIGGESPRARDMAAVTGAVCLLVLAIVVVTWVPAAAAACVEGDPDCNTFGSTSAWTFTLMLAPIVALVAGLWRVGLFDLSSPEHEITATQAPANEPPTAGSDASESTAGPQPDADSESDEDSESERGAKSEEASKPDEASKAKPDDTPAEMLELAPRVAGEVTDDDATHRAALSLLEVRPLAVVLSHAEAAAVNGAALTLARRLDASIYMVGSHELTKSPDFESEHALAGRIGHEDELALAVAGRALAAVLFVDARGEFSDFTLEMLGELDSACFADEPTPVAHHCRVVLPCAPPHNTDPEGDDSADPGGEDPPWPTRLARLARLDDDLVAKLIDGTAVVDGARPDTDADTGEGTPVTEIETEPEPEPENPESPESTARGGGDAKA